MEFFVVFCSGRLRVSVKNGNRNDRIRVILVVSVPDSVISVSVLYRDPQIDMNRIFHVSEDGSKIKPVNSINTGTIIPGEKVIAKKDLH